MPAEVIVTKSITKDHDANQTIKVVTREIKEAPEPAPVVATLPDLQTMIIITGVVAVCVYGSVEVLKAFAKRIRDLRKRWWYDGGVRLSAIVIGAALGWALYESLGGPGSGYPIGCACGAAAGILDVVIVKQVRRRIKNATNGKSDGPS